MHPLAEMLSSRHKVLVYDRRNCGASDILIQDVPSEFDLWVDDLHVLLELLGMAPAYVGGASGGAALSLLLAHRYPEDVRGLLLFLIPTDDPGLLADVCRDRYLVSAELAESKGMQAVVEASVWRELFLQNPSQRERFLSMDAQTFATVMRRWWTSVTSGRFLGGLTDEELCGIAAPAIVIPGLDKLHPKRVVERLHALLPNSKLVLPEEHFSPAEMERFHEWYRKDHSSHDRYNPALAPILDSFMQEIEAKT
jgi:pimeloyl-ACP methyl ester carboxylesterase